MNRYVLVLCSVALGATQPISALAAPPAAAPVYHPVSRSGAAPMPHARSDSQGRWDSQAPFRMPFDLNLHPKSQQFDPQTTWSPLRWHQWRPVPGSLTYQPIWYQLGCYPSNMPTNLWSSSGTADGAYAPPSSFTIGSLVDGHGSLFGSSPPDLAKMASSGKNATGASNLLTLQSTPCGAANSFNF